MKRSLWCQILTFQLNDEFMICETGSVAEWQFCKLICSEQQISRFWNDSSTILHMHEFFQKLAFFVFCTQRCKGPAQGFQVLFGWCALFFAKKKKQMCFSGCSRICPPCSFANLILSQTFHVWRFEPNWNSSLFCIFMRYSRRRFLLLSRSGVFNLSICPQQTQRNDKTSAVLLIL